MQNDRSGPERDHGEQTDGAVAASPSAAAAADVLVVGGLPESVLRRCGVVTTARTVWMHADVIRKLESKRPENVEFILNHIPDAVTHPHYCGLDRRDGTGRRMDLVHLVTAYEGRALFVALKLVAAGDSGSGGDEIWVSSAYPLPANFLTQPRYSDMFQTVGS